MKNFYTKLAFAFLFLQAFVFGAAYASVTATFSLDPQVVYAEEEFTIVTSGCSASQGINNIEFWVDSKQIGNNYTTLSGKSTTIDSPGTYTIKVVVHEKNTGSKNEYSKQVTVAPAPSSFAVSVDLNDEHQSIRGFGGMIHRAWQGYGLTAAERDMAYGTGDGCIGLSVLRIPVNDNENLWSNELDEAKALIARGGTVYATPWKAPAGMLDSYTLHRGSETYQTTQLLEKNWQTYTDYLNKFTKYMRDKGAPLYAISIQNEPDWCSEWTCWTAENIVKYIKNYADQLRANGTKVITPESFAYSKNYYDGIINDASALKNIDIIGAHFYGSDANSPDGYFQYPLADQKASGKERWMTEHYTESKGSANMWIGEIVSGDQDVNPELKVVRALDVAYDVHRCLVEGNFNEYTWWYIKRNYSFIMEKEQNDKSCKVSASEAGKVSKRGYIMSQFARFVRPGAVRVGSTKKPGGNLLTSAYKKGDSIVVVVINRDTLKDRTVDISIPGASNVSSWQVFSTSATKSAERGADIAASNGKFSFKLEKESISTFVGISKDCDVSISLDVPQRAATGAKVSLAATTEPDNVHHVDFFCNDSCFRHKYVYPYIHDTVFSSPGIYAIRTVAYVSEGCSASANDTIRIDYPKGPYSGKPVSIPGTIQAEEFDFGGEGISYHDTEVKNKGGLFRLHDDVDIDSVASGGYAVGFTQKGEWLDYSVNVSKAGLYTFKASVSSGNGGSGFHLEALGSDGSFSAVSNTVSVPQGDDWSTYSLVSDTLTSELPEGLSTLRLVIDGSFCNIDSLAFQRVVPAGSDAVLSDAVSVLPNPARNVVNILGCGGPLSVRVFDISGRLLLTSNSSVVNIQGLRTGVYFFKVASPSGVFTCKVVKVD